LRAYIYPGRGRETILLLANTGTVSALELCSEKKSIIFCWRFAILLWLAELLLCRPWSASWE
jgi:hypothetical protein